MIVYRRNINGSIITLWILLLIGVTGIIYSLSTGWTFFAVGIFAFLIVLAFLQIKRLTLIPGEIHIDKYYFYGFKQKGIQIDHNSSIKAELFFNGNIDQVPDSDSPLGFVVFLIPFLYKKYALWIKTAENKTIIILKLTKAEFRRLEEMKSFDKALPLT
jgi:hypothetical protein